MKFCMHCGKEIKETVKFCPFCGGEQKEISTISEENVATISHVDSTVERMGEIISEPVKEEQTSFTEYSNTESQQHDTTQQAQRPNETPLISINQESVNQLADKSKNYLSYLNQNVKSPTLGGVNNFGAFGLISYFVINTLLSLGLSHALGKSITGLNFQFKLFLPLLLLILVAQLVNVLAVFLLGNKIFKVNINLMDTFDRIYAPTSIGVYTAVVMFFLTFVSRFGFSFIFTIFLTFTFFLINISYIANIWTLDSFATNKNKFYWTIGMMILAFVVQIIANFLLGDIVGGSLIGLIEDIANSITSNMFF